MEKNKSSVFTDSSIIRRLSIHYGPGLSCTPDRNCPWSLVLKRLNEGGDQSYLVVDFWEDNGAKSHPLLKDHETPGFSYTPNDGDRLLRATIIPRRHTVTIDDLQYPQSLRLQASKLELTICGEEIHHVSAAAQLKIWPQLAQLSVEPIGG